MDGKVHFGTVGLGRLGKVHAENIAYNVRNAELVAACSIVEEELVHARENLGIANTYLNYEDMLKNETLDAVFICSSSGLHCTQIQQALEAGFHVFSEKPMGITVDEVRQTAEAVAQHPDQTFMLGFMRRYDDNYVYAKEKIDRGEIGRPFMIRCYGLDPIGGLDGFVNFLRAGGSGGLFLDMAIHDIDLARWYMESEVRSVYALGGCYVVPEVADYGDVDNGMAMIQFQNDAVAMLYAGRTCPHGYQVETEIIGTKGSIRIAGVPEKNLVLLYNEQGAVRECIQSFPERFKQAYINEVQEFVDCVREGRIPGVGAMDGVKSTEIAYACQDSLSRKEVIRLT
jgi:myo-inositol 2-dehydrogenase/D-chiro-inositol 1-dehydrogenase